MKSVKPALPHLLVMAAGKTATNMLVKISTQRTWPAWVSFGAVDPGELGRKPPFPAMDLTEIPAGCRVLAVVCLDSTVAAQLLQELILALPACKLEPVVWVLMHSFRSAKCLQVLANAGIDNIQNLAEVRIITHNMVYVYLKRQNLKATADEIADDIQSRLADFLSREIDAISGREAEARPWWRRWFLKSR